MQSHDQRVAVGSDHTVCPRCNQLWTSHSPSKAQRCIDSGVAYFDGDKVDEHIRSDGKGEVAVKMVVRWEPDTVKTEPVRKPTSALMAGLEDHAVYLAHKADRLGKMVSDTDRRVNQLQALGAIAPPCMPAEMPDTRLKLLKGWDSPGWRIIAERVDDTDGVHLSGSLEEPARYIEWEKRTLTQADLWWVGSEMCDIVYAAAPNIPDEVMLENLSWPGRRGLVVFEKPHFGLDAVNPQHIATVDAILWGPARLSPSDEWPDGRAMITISLYRLLDFGLGMSRSELELAVNTGAVNGGVRRRVGVDDKGNPVMSLTGREWVPLGRSDWPLDSQLAEPPDGLNPHADAARYAAYVASGCEDRRVLAALWALIGTKSIATVTERTPDRAARRRAERAGLTEPSTVKVVYLRRPDVEPADHDDTESHPVNWSHRWMVNAHPRLQPYGPGGKYRKLIMVAPHVKGPTDKPLVVKSTVKALVR